MRKAVIFQPTKNAMQSGKANTKKWRLMFEMEEEIRTIDPLMGWTSAHNMLPEINLEFDTREEAIEYAKREHIDYRVKEPKTRTTKIRSYTDNFTRPPSTVDFI